MNAQPAEHAEKHTCRRHSSVVTITCHSLKAATHSTPQYSAASTSRRCSSSCPWVCTLCPANVVIRVWVCKCVQTQHCRLPAQATSNVQCIACGNTFNGTLMSCHCAMGQRALLSAAFPRVSKVCVRAADSCQCSLSIVVPRDTCLRPETTRASINTHLSEIMSMILAYIAVWQRTGLRCLPSPGQQRLQESQKLASSCSCHSTAHYTSELEVQMLTDTCGPVEATVARENVCDKLFTLHCIQWRAGPTVQPTAPDLRAPKTLRAGS